MFHSGMDIPGRIINGISEGNHKEGISGEVLKKNLEDLLGQFVEKFLQKFSKEILGEFAREFLEEFSEEFL